MRRKVRLAICGSHGIPAIYGGYETITQELSTRLVERGLDVYVSCESNGLRSKPHDTYKGVHLVYFPVIGSLRNISEPMLYDVLSVVWATFTADVIYMLGYSSVFTLPFPKFFGKPIIVNVDGLEWTRPKFGRVLKYIYHAFEIMNTKIADRIVVDSRTIGAYYRRVYGLHTIYVTNGISQIAPLDSTALERFGLKANGYYLAIARLVPDNNVDLIIDGFERSCTEKKLAIVGPLDRTRSSKDYVTRLVSHRNDSVVFLGGIYDAPLQRTLRHNCFAYIHGHDRGGTNPSLVEALSCGNRMLVIDSPFNREVARDAALYFKKDSGDLARKIELIERKPFNRAKRARTIYEEGYTAEQAAESFTKLVTSMIANSR